APAHPVAGVAALGVRFELENAPSEISGAVLRATAHGIYEASIDGAAVTDSVLNPGWTVYESRLQVQEFDVSSLLQDGTDSDHTLRVLLGRGWWNGDFGFRNADANYGSEPGLLAALTITYKDGSTQEVLTGEDWRSESTPITFATLYDGQREDRRQDPGELAPVRALEVDRSTLIPQASPLICRQEVLRPEKIWTSPGGNTLLDFGQNLVGWLRFTVAGPEGTEITLRHAEVLENEELGTRPLRSAEATDRLILTGDPSGEAFEPTFTFHGFRYAEVSGWPGELTPDDIEAVVVHSDTPRTGWFESSHEGLDQLIRNSVWSQKGNFLAVPTDCPQRDERLGWTGDIAAYAATAAFQFDVDDFLHNWLLDLAAETRANPAEYVPFVVPDILKYATFPEDFTVDAESWTGATAIWGDAAVWVPQALWHAYGNLDRLREQYPGMVLHLESVNKALSPNGLWDTGWQFGDWLDPDAPPEKADAAKADKRVVALICLFRSATFAAEVARLIGEDADVERWQGLADRTRDAFTEHYLQDNGRILSDATTVYSLAIVFGILSEDMRRAAGERLSELVREAGYRVSTGFAGTPYITWALSETGHIEDAYRLLLETECPSWLYPVSMGATTIWERWDSMLPDGSINPGEMTSFNHYALGAVADWVYQVVLGIRPAAPGYSRIRIQPTPGPGIDWARGAYDSRHGRIEVSWSVDGDRIALEATVPDGIEAEIVLPDGSTESVVGTGASLTRTGELSAR
ncbi:MAG: family 78 glycoside hydrolase catalytic domain, partial [Brachybacterium sp.]|nr:family 78 glycoside hydrolase catalytic domain [Brachybacterium sp.]